LLRMTVVLPLSALVNRISECCLVKDLVILRREDRNLLGVLSSMLLKNSIDDGNGKISDGFAN